MKKKTDFKKINNGNREEKSKAIILSGFSDKQLNNFINL